MSMTLRELNQLNPAPSTLTNSTLILIDYQNTYTKGVMELTGWQEALNAAEALLRQARQTGTPIIHVIHDGGAGSPYDLQAELGQIHTQVAPLEYEAIVIKKAPNAFIDTTLLKHIEAMGRSKLILCGFMTHMCVTFSSEGAFLHGYTPTVVAQACATRPLLSAVGAVSAAELHKSALATIADLYGVVVPTAQSLQA